MRTSKWNLATLVLPVLIVFGASAAWALDHPVNIGKFQPWFTPVQIIIGPTDTVTWTNNDPATTHTVTSLGSAPFGAAIPTPGAAFGSGKMLPGDTFTAGPFGPGTTSPYICLIHPWMAGNVSTSPMGVGPVPEILQGTPSQDMNTPDHVFAGYIGIGEWCTTATYEYSGNFPFQGVVHCGSAHLWKDASPSAPQALEEHRDSGVTSANQATFSPPFGFPPLPHPNDLVDCGNGHRGIGGRFDGATTTHNLWNNNHFTLAGTLIGPNGTAVGNLDGNAGVISQPARECLTFSTNLHGQTFQSIKRTPPSNQGIIGSTNTLFAGDVTHVMTNPGGTVGWVTMEAGQDCNPVSSSNPTPGFPESCGTVHGHLGIFNPNNPPAQITNFINLGTNFPHGNWVCGNGRFDTVPAPLSNTIGVAKIPATPGGAGSVVAFFPSAPFGVAGVYPVATGTLPNCTKAYTSNAVDHRISVTDAMTALPAGATGVDLGICGTCTLMGSAVPTVHIPIQITPMPDNSLVVVQVSKASKLAIIDTSTDMVIQQKDCGDGCHGSYIGPRLGGGFHAYLVASAAYQDKMSILDLSSDTPSTFLEKVGDVKTNMHSLLGLQGTTPVGSPNIVTLSPAVGWNSGTITWPQMLPWK